MAQQTTPEGAPVLAMEQCPHCLRSFEEKIATRHIPLCVRIKTKPYTKRTAVIHVPCQRTLVAKLGMKPVSAIGLRGIQRLKSTPVKTKKVPLPCLPLPAPAVHCSLWPSTAHLLMLTMLYRVDPRLALLQRPLSVSWTALGACS